MDARILDSLVDRLARSGDFDGFVLSDYGKGVLTDAALAAFIADAAGRGVPVVVDPKRGARPKANSCQRPMTWAASGLVSKRSGRPLFRLRNRLRSASRPM